MSGGTYGPAFSASKAAGSLAEREAWLAFALDACEAADAVARRWFRRDVEVSTKPDRSYVTAADQEIERLIRGRIADRFPAHGVVGEEYGADEGAGEARWFIDPIDGTANFVRGVPVFGTLVALEVGEELQVGAISMAALDERWWAGRGLGAWAGRTGALAASPRRIGVSEVDGVADAHLLYGELDELESGAATPGFRSLVRSVWRTRNFGDCWMYGLLAEGSAEIVIEADLNTWDLAAPALIVEEAGGRVTDFDGNRTIGNRSVLATNGALHDGVLARLRQQGPLQDAHPG
jgi:histidinol-phosphatase